MTRILTTLTIAAFLLSGCGAIRDSRINPFNWFGRAESRAIPAEEVNPLIPRQNRMSSSYQPETRVPVARIDDLVVERVPGGAILRVTATAAYQDSFNVGLVPARETGPVDGVASYTLLANLPGGRHRLRVGAEQTRVMTEALYLSDKDLEEIRVIEVRGAQNSLTVRR
ncbi:hypothetical protein [Pseudooceanicola aestuarii]|uniref:hypothetical protein n=1 Tax=Pseudooceanicola aestuarii TaxID=2697319 RepID=UPI0013D42AE2|nr:hypothetical protein [Pseudooceanicola aestuarii]